MPHVIDLEKLLEEIRQADRPSCQWLPKVEAIEIIIRNAEKLDAKLVLKK